MSIAFQEATILEYGDEADPMRLVKKATGTITQLPKIDTHTLGDQKLTYVLEQDGYTKTITHTITVQDTKPAIIELKKERIELEYAEKFDAASNIRRVYDPVDGELDIVKEKKKNAYMIESKLNTKKAGTYPIKVMAWDRNDHPSEATFQVIVKEKTEKETSDARNTNMGAGKASDKKSKPSSDSSSEVQNPTYINGILLVNRTHPLPKNYGKTDPTAYAALQRLQKAAKQAGYSIPLISGYRSYAYQVELYNGYVARDGQQAADRYSARPGTSEHQSGLVFDIGSIDNNYGNTAAGKWLAAHCAEHGFIIRFPQGKESITGYMYEPWHVRYVGVDAAGKIMA